MDVVISMTPSAQDANRVTVRVGQPGRTGRSVGTLSARLAEGAGVLEGVAWTDELAGRFAEALAVDQAMRDAMNRLNRRALSRRHLDRKLRERGHDADARSAALDRLSELGLIDDAAYGAALAEETVRRKGAGPRLVEQKLRAKGLDGEEAKRIAEAATGDEEAQRAAATAAAEKKLRSMAGANPAAWRRRLYGLLGRRGYAPEVINDVMEAMADRLDNPSDASA